MSCLACDSNAGQLLRPTADRRRFTAFFSAAFSAAILIATAVFASSELYGDEISVSSDFASGSGDVIAIATTGEVTTIEIMPSMRQDRGWPCWWYVRVNNARVGQRIDLMVRGNEQPFRGTQKLSSNWALPQRAVISVDDVNWVQTEASMTTPKTATYTIVSPATTFWVAWGTPFHSQHADALLGEVATLLNKAGQPQTRFELARSRDNRSVQAIRFGNDTAKDSVWVQARQHAWESGGSWVGEGFVRWAASDDPLAVQLRQHAEIFFVPIMDVDNVDRGAGGKDATPRDHNRDWADRPFYPEVLAAQTEIRRQIDAGRLRVYMDLHNPAPSDHVPFYFGPLDYDQLPQPVRLRYDRFLELSTEFIRGPLAIHPSYRFATYVPTAEEQSRVSRNWVGDRMDQRGISLTLETSWNTPASTVEGYREVGRGLAKTISHYLLENRKGAPTP